MSGGYGRRTRRGAYAAGLALLVAWLVWGPLAAPAGAAPADEWEILSFESEIAVSADGAVQVTETIAVRFHVPSRGIYREIPFRAPVDADTVRRYRFDEITVTAGPGTPADLDESISGDYLVWRIGDPDTELTGPHTYTIAYRIRGALNRFDTHDELFLNVTGDRWDVPIQRATATVTAPAISDARCFAGATGGTDPCADATHTGDTARFAATALQPGEQLDVVVAMPPGVVAVAAPDLEPASRLRRVFQVDPVRGGVAGVLLLGGVAGVVVLARRGRDEPAGNLAGALPGGVEYRPPDDLRPAQLRTLLTEKVDDVSLSATLVDLAVRGHVRIEEIADDGGKREDWLLNLLPATTDGLHPYEREVLGGLREKATDDRVTVSALGKGEFHKRYQNTSRKLYDDVVRRGFYAHNPSHVRAGFGVIAVAVLLVGGGGVAAALALDWSVGLIFVPLVLVGVPLLAASQKAPRRTAAGATMRRRAAGFRDFVRTAEADRMDFAERERIFVDYLPYAMAFNCVDGWVRAFERLGVPAAAAAGTWYVGHGVFDAGRMTSSMSSLATQVGGTMRATASSSGSSGFSGGGFSGGGVGGGGGGRW